ncbi:MAG: SpoIID/LytB domain-containing protein [Lachnospiraceae bacterium]|nr:SpoIID/LytB domain-containing protein [Lachnospiraceae bacterium]
MKQLLIKNRMSITITTMMILFSVLFPYIVTLTHIKKMQLKIYEPKPYGRNVIVSGNGENEKLDIEMFIPLVLYSVMPEDYDDETKKAMIVIIRTYIVYKMNEQNNENDSIRNENLGLPYTTYSELEKKWGKKYESKYNKTMKLIEETNGEVIYYQGEPIFPYYHEISAGMTNEGEYEYLKSVESKADTEAEDYMKILYFTSDSLIEKLSTKISDELTTENINEKITLHINENSEYVESVDVGEENLSALEWQKLFEIPSTAFTFEQFADGYKMVSKGKGCGKGLSIYGAEKMAGEGKNYQEILEYYYTGVDIHD